MTPFRYKPLATVSRSVSTASANVALLEAPEVGDFQVRVYNAGAATVFFKFGDSSATATIASPPMPSGAIEVWTVPEGTTHVAAISASGTATLYATTGDGA